MPNLDFRSAALRHLDTSKTLLALSPILSGSKLSQKHYARPLKFNSLAIYPSHTSS